MLGRIVAGGHHTPIKLWGNRCRRNMDTAFASPTSACSCTAMSVCRAVVGTNFLLIRHKTKAYPSIACELLQQNDIKAVSAIADDPEFRADV
jgi:hypothetical protein